MFREPLLPVRLLRKSSYPARYVLSITIRGAIRTSRMPKPVAGSAHDYKYSLTLVADGLCAVRYDDEAGKNDHMRVAGRGVAYPSGCAASRFLISVEAQPRWSFSHREKVARSAG